MDSLLNHWVLYTNKHGAESRHFSGGWKLNESKTELTQQFPVCIFGKDRMRSKTMKIVSVDQRWKVYFYQGKFELNLWRKYYDARIR